MPLVSILVPVYQTEKYLTECLESLIHQTLQDIEIICVNDGSTDGSGKILRHYQNIDPRVKVVNKKNGGLPSARNAGLDVATGEYVGFVDSDDYVDLKMFERLYQAAKRDQSEIVICGAHIFPVPPHPEGWLYQVLSPRDAYYPEFEPKILFEEAACRPFIWRVFVKRDLIERNQIRLQEDIHIGEDNAFQFRLYPLAKGITFLSDKLYHYRWYREGSLMNTAVYTDFQKRIEKHIILVRHIAEKWKETGFLKEMSFEFLKWSVHFLYDDFIKLPLNDKIKLAKQIVPVWEGCNYYQNQNRMPVYLKEMFDYFFCVMTESPISPKISVILCVSDNNPFLEQSINSVLHQSLREIELICINNAAPDETYAILHKFLHQDKRFRLINQSKNNLAKALNKALLFVSGEYITFLDTNDYYFNPSSLASWYKKAKQDQSEVCVSLYEQRDSIDYVPMIQTIPISENPDFRYILDNDFHNILYQTAFIKKLELQIKDYSIFTGFYFLINSCLKSETVSLFQKITYIHRKRYQKDWIPTSECVLVLDCMIELLELSIQFQNAQLHSKVISLLNSDYYLTMLINNTRPYCMPESSCPNGENSQIEIWSRLLKISTSIRAELLTEIPKTEHSYHLPNILSIFVDGRHKFLSDQSNQYKYQ